VPHLLPVLAEWPCGNALGYTKTVKSGRGIETLAKTKQNIFLMKKLAEIKKVL
jgi:hypothetical protein